MKFLEDEIEIKLYSRNISHYEKLGYDLPRTVDDQGRLRVKLGTPLRVKTKDLPKSSNIEVEFVCEECSNIIIRKISHVNYFGLHCPNCSDGFNYPEKFIHNVFAQLQIQFEFQKTFTWLRSKIYDFYIPSLNMIVEVHGRQHYDNSNFQRSLKEEQENDKLKYNTAVKNNIKNYIVIDARYSELGWIKNSIMNTDLAKVFDFRNVDWKKCNEHATKSIVKSVCELWNNGTTSVIEISKIMNLSENTIRNYLKHGVSLGWCDYNPKTSRKLIGFENTKRIKVVQLSLDDTFLKVWNSVSEAERETGISAIGRACKSEKKTARGFKWVFLDDYEKYIIEQDKLHKKVI